MHLFPVSVEDTVEDRDPIKCLALSHLVHSLAWKPFRGHVLVVFVLSHNWSREALGQPVGTIQSPRAKGKSLRQRSPLGSGRSQRWAWGGYGNSFCSFVDKEAALDAGQRWGDLTWGSGADTYARMKSWKWEDAEFRTAIIQMAVQQSEKGLGEVPARKVCISRNSLAGLTQQVFLLRSQLKTKKRSSKTLTEGEGENKEGSWNAWTQGREGRKIKINTDATSYNKMLGGQVRKWRQITAFHYEPSKFYLTLPSLQAVTGEDSFPCLVNPCKNLLLGACLTSC